MNFCTMYDCGGSGDKEFLLLPVLIKNQGERTLQLPISHRDKWLAAIGVFVGRHPKRENFDYYKICGGHFTKGWVQYMRLS